MTHEPDSVEDTLKLQISRDATFGTTTVMRPSLRGLCHGRTTSKVTPAATHQSMGEYRRTGYKYKLIGAPHSDKSATALYRPST